MITLNFFHLLIGQAYDIYGGIHLYQSTFLVKGHTYMCALFLCYEETLCSHF